MFRPAAKASDFHSLEALSRQLSLAPPACSWSSWLSSEPGEQSLWSRLSMDHMTLLVSGCSISSKSRCSDGAGKHQQASPPTSLARVADCFCAGYQLPVSLAGLFVARQPPLWITVLPLWLWSCALSAPGPGSSRAQLCLPTGLLSLVQAPCWRVEAEQAGSLGSLGWAESTHPSPDLLASGT